MSSEATTVSTESAIPQPVPAGPAIYTLDPSHSEVAFQVRHLVTTVRGRFDDFAATIHMDTASPERSSVDFTVRTASINTRNEERDAHLRSADFFDVEHFPEITFKSGTIRPLGDDQYEVAGTLTIKGVSQELTLPVTYLGAMRDPWGNDKAGFETATTLNRKDFGVSWNAALDAGGFLLGDTVKVSVDLEAVRKP